VRRGANARLRMNSIPSRRRFFCATLALSIALLLTSCFFPHGRKTERSSSVVNFLYPNQTNPLPSVAIPVLRLPLRVGVAFVPSSNDADRFAATGISERQKSALLERVAAEFKNREYIQSIEIVPTSYLRAGGGFSNLDQVRALLGVDVIALVAFDQVQFTNANFLSLSYWTIVGAYIFQGNQNDTQTLMEAAVYDIQSQHLLFRAPGGSQVKAGAAAVYLAQNLRADSSKGFDDATTELIQNLKTQLEAFRERMKKIPGRSADRTQARLHRRRQCGRRICRGCWIFGVGAMEYPPAALNFEMKGGASE